MQSIKINLKTVLYLSFIPFVMHSFRHLQIGTYIPMLIALLVVTLAGLSMKFKKLKFFIKFWSILIILYGLIRLGMSTLMLFSTSGIPSDIYYQIDFSFVLISLFYLDLGIYLYMKRNLSYS